MFIILIRYFFYFFTDLIMKYAGIMSYRLGTSGGYLVVTSFTPSPPTQLFFVVFETVYLAVWLLGCLSVCFLNYFVFAVVVCHCCSCVEPLII